MTLQIATFKDDEGGYWYYHYLSRLYSFIPHVFFHCLNGHLFSMRKIPAARAPLHRYYQRPREVLYFPCTAGGNYRDGHTFADVFHQFNIKTAFIKQKCYYLAASSIALPAFPMSFPAPWMVLHPWKRIARIATNITGVIIFLTFIILSLA